ncbi:MAG: ABC transporter ATP-binding protein [Bacillota bacterium]|nr:ABC transporter ATP-binding protein [Bacillota bacterium]
MNKDVLVEIKNYSVFYPQVKALNSISLKIIQGETYSILGPSGCGKTTFLHAVANLLPDKCEEKGRIISRDNLRKSIVFQDYGLFPWKTVKENVLLPIKIKGEISNRYFIKYKELVKKLKISEYSNSYPDNLSGGQKQRVAVARSWIMEPDLLLLDEPFSSLDAITRESLQDTVVNLYNQNPITIITVTHSIEEAVFMGKNIILLNENGEIKNHIKNENFGDTKARDKEEFYNKCLILRKLIKGL